MSAIFNEMRLTWKGKEYRVKPTMALLNKIEQEVSLSRLAARITTGDAPFSHLALVISHFLRSAGAAQASPEAVYQVIMSAEQEAVAQMAGAVMLAVFPSTGKVQAPAQPSEQQQQTEGDLPPS